MIDPNWQARVDRLGVAVALELMRMEAGELKGPPLPRPPDRKVLRHVMFAGEKAVLKNWPQERAKIEGIAGEQLPDLDEIGVFIVHFPQVATCQTCGMRIRADQNNGMQRVAAHSEASGHKGWDGAVVPPWDPRAKETTITMPGEYGLMSQQVAHAVIADPNKVRRR